jgi:hypothetical protein
MYFPLILSSIRLLDYFLSIRSLNLLLCYVPTFSLYLFFLLLTRVVLLNNSPLLQR